MPKQSNVVKLKQPTEYQECFKFWSWVLLNPQIRDISFHIPNEAKRSAGLGFALKRIGLRPGVSDYFIACPVGPYHGLWIEMKRAHRTLSKITPEQQAWLFSMLAKGYDAQICYGADHAIETVQNYLIPCGTIV